MPQAVNVHALATVVLPNCGCSGQPEQPIVDGAWFPPGLQPAG
jgi:hypothetical protein